MKRVLVVLLILAVIGVLCACDVQTGNRVVRGRDVQTFSYAYIALGGERLVEGYVTQWRDYENSDTVQVLVNGKYYLTHYTNVVLIADPSMGNLGYSNSGVYGVTE